MANKKYEITQEQLFQLQHLKQRFSLTASQVQNLCHKEHNDIVQGFELGKIYSDLMLYFTKFDQLEDDILEQETPNMDDSEPDYSNKKQW